MLKENFGCQLVKKAQQGSQQAMLLIIDGYRPLVSERARLYYLAGAEYDDLFQEGMIGLYKAVRDYRADRDASFSTFARMCIARQVLSAVKSSLRKKHVPLNSYVSFSTLIENDDSGDFFSNVVGYGLMIDPERLFISKENHALFEEMIDRTLSELEREVLVRYIQGKTYKDISFELGRTQKTVDNAMQRIKRKLELFVLNKN